MASIKKRKSTFSVIDVYKRHIKSFWHLLFNIYFPSWIVSLLDTFSNVWTGLSSLIPVSYTHLNIGLKFAFRSTDTNEIKQTLEFFGLDSEDENNQKRLRDLENGQCLMQDLYGRVGVCLLYTSAGRTGGVRSESHRYGLALLVWR